MLESSDDRLQMLKSLGELVTVNGQSVYAIPENEYREIDLNGQIIESNLPAVICRTEDVSSAVHGTSVIAEGSSYTVREVRPDGTGMTTLILSETV